MIPRYPHLGMGRDHTTVLHAVRTVDGDCKEDPEINKQVITIDGQLTGA